MKSPSLAKAITEHPKYDPKLHNVITAVAKNDGEKALLDLMSSGKVSPTNMGPVLRAAWKQSSHDMQCILSDPATNARNLGIVSEAVYKHGANDVLEMLRNRDIPPKDLLILARAASLSSPKLTMRLYSRQGKPASAKEVADTVEEIMRYIQDKVDSSSLRAADKALKRKDLINAASYFFTHAGAAKGDFDELLKATDFAGFRVARDVWNHPKSSRSNVSYIADLCKLHGEGLTMTALEQDGVTGENIGSVVIPLARLSRERLIKGHEFGDYARLLARHTHVLDYSDHIAEVAKLYNGPDLAKRLAARNEAMAYLDECAAKGLDHVSLLNHMIQAKKQGVPAERLIPYQREFLEHGHTPTSWNMLDYYYRFGHKKHIK